MDSLRQDTLFYIFQFNSKEIHKFSNRVDLKDYLKKQELPDFLQMMTIKGYYRRFW